MFFNTIVLGLALIFMSYRLIVEFIRLYKAYKQGLYIDGCIKHSREHLVIIIFLLVFGISMFCMMTFHSYEHLEAIEDSYEFHINIIHYIMLFFYIGVAELVVNHMKSEKLKPYQ